jgi:BirA family biotin operon repressor/biotin-[acetyl-CoA-carboxylase] ligase
LPPTRWVVPLEWTLHYVPTTGSTNDDARELALAGCADRTIVVADEQRNGRGRVGRRWVAPRSSSLLVSLVLRRPIPPVLLTALCSITLVDSIADLTGLVARIKWPNDVMLGDKKVCGILTEVLSRDDQPITVVGVGLNVNLIPTAAGLPSTAASLSSELGRRVDRAALLRTLLDRIDRHLELADEAMRSTIWRRWEALLWRRSQAVRVKQDGPTLYGVIEGLSPSGALRLRTPDGELNEVSVGDVSSV